MKAPIEQLNKQQIVALYKGKCRHGHRYLEHYGCYQEETGNKLRVGFLDIETSNLAADFGIVFLYCIKVAGEDKILERVITDKELHGSLDKGVLEQVIEDMQKFDLLITYYGTKFDIPFLRTRALYHGLHFPEFGAVQHKDAYYIIKSKFRLSRNRMEQAARILLGKTEKTHINSVYWLKALQGDRRSLNYILDHCRKDVLDLERLYDAVRVYVKNTTKSI